MRSKVFSVLLFTTDAASESNANAVCKLPSGEEEGEAKRNSSRPGNAQLARRRLKREIVKMRWRVLTRFPQARERVAERQRRCSEADTGRRTGASFGLNLLAVLWAEFLRLVEPRSPPPPHAADCNSTELVAVTAGGELL